jgi:hypothetical protein
MAYEWNQQTTGHEKLSGQESQSKWQNLWKTPSTSSEEAVLAMQPPHRKYDALESFQDQVESRSVGSKKKRRRAQNDTSYHKIQDSNNSSRRAISPSETLRKRLQIHHSEHRNLQLDASSTCEGASLFEESEGELFGTSCQCLLNDDASVTMLCEDTACHYCNNDWTVCGEYTYGVIFDDRGWAIAFIEQDEYHLGRSDLVVYTDYIGEGCTVSINDEECASCDFSACANGGVGMKAQCSNLPGGTDYSSCDLNFHTDGALQMFNAGEFDVCFQPEATPEEACLRDAALEGQSECMCSEDENVPGRYILHCVDPCVYCDEALSTCGREVSDKSYGPIFGVVRAVRSTIQYSFGRDEELIVEETGCDEGSGCQACTAQVNGVQCDICLQQTCSTAEGGLNAANLDCANIEAGAVFDLCREEQIHIDDGAFQYFSGVITDTCVLESELSCIQARSFFQSSEGGGYECSCELLADDGSVELSCADVCEYCDEDITVCGRESFVLDFDRSGTVSYRRNDFAYSFGRNETLVFEEHGDDGCTFSVDSKSCNSCEVRPCTTEAESIEAPFLDCSNIENSATFNLCDSDTSVQDGIFQHFSVDEFNECTDRTPSNSFCAEALNFNNTAGSTVFGSTELAAFDEVKACGGSTSSAGLWYTIVGPGAGVAISACMPETDINAQVSIYSGGCNALECITGYVGCNASAEVEGSASWFADEGVVYHIRVDTSGGAAGSFGLKIEDLDISMIACVSKKEETDAVSGTKNSCLCENTGVGARLTCVDDCDYCNGDMDVCTSETHMWRFNRYGDIGREVASHQYSKGRNETVVFERSSCNGLSDCQDCQVTVNGENCVSCDIFSCSGGAAQGLAFDCSNIQEGLVRQSNCHGLELATGPFEMLLGGEFETCTRDPMRVCETLALAEENSKTTCSCREYGNSSVALTCEVIKCQFCNDDGTSCAIRTYGTTIDHEGEETGQLEGFTYTTGINERVLIEEANDGSCSVSVDGEKCNSCQIACDTLEEETDLHGYQIDCENIRDGASFNTCNSVSQTGTFQVFNDAEFGICLPANFYPEAICLTEKEVKERQGSRFRKGTSCQCIRSADGAYSLECVDEDCTYCNSNVTVCANNTFGVEYNRFGYQVSAFTGMQYVDGGRDQLVIFEDLEDSCSVTVDAQTCNSCEYQTCASSNGTDVTGRLIHCENVEEGAIFDECEGIFSPGGLLEVFRSPAFETCHDHSISAKQVCGDLSVKEEDLDSSVACECMGEGAYGDYRLACVHLNCLYCNDEKTSCGNEMFATSINRFGEIRKHSEGFHYNEGRTDLVEYHEEIDPLLGDVGCSLSVNGLECTSCEFVTCLDATGANTTAISVQCDNVPEGANFNKCEAVYIEEGALEYYSDLEFEQCISVQDPAVVCTVAKNNTEMGDTSGGTTCNCLSTSTGGYVMSCEIPECQYCNSNMSQCALSDLFGVEISKFGEYIAYFDAYDYIVGKDHHYLMEETDEECHVAIDAIECTSCSYVTCFDEEGTEYESYKIDCSDIDESLVFECDQGADLFDILIDASFDVCTPYNATEAAAADLLPNTNTTLPTGGAGWDSFPIVNAFGQSGDVIAQPSPSLPPISEPNRGRRTSDPEPTLSPTILDSAASEMGARQVLTLLLSIAVSAWLIHF